MNEKTDSPSEESVKESVWELADEIETQPVLTLPPPAAVVTDRTLEKDIIFVRRIVTVGIALVMLSAAVYVGGILFGENGLVSYRPADSALESQKKYIDLVQFDDSDLTGEGVRVCIVDSGFELDHPDLAGFSVHLWKDFVNNRSTPYDDQGHGTSMAGILVASGWMKGIAPDVELLVAKALTADGSGDDEIVAEAIDWCAANNADIISLSLGGAPGILPFNFGGGRSSDDASNDAINQGIFVVAAAGNDGGDQDDGDVASPCGERNVICVGGTTMSGSHWVGSSTGDNNGRLLPFLLPRSDPNKKPELVAPAQSVAVINSQGSWSLVDGTSAATVFVTGAIALLLENNPELSNSTSSSNVQQVKQWIQQSSLPYEGQTEHDDDYGYGLLQTRALISSANTQ
jgi:serine protease AprX